MEKDEEDSAGQPESYSAKSSGLQQCQANLVCRQRLTYRPPRPHGKHRRLRERLYQMFFTGSDTQPAADMSSCRD
jgi:hypothetical protein